MKLLLFGFKPYKEYKDNITEKIVRKTSDRKDLIKIIFPAKLEDKIFLEKIKGFKPDVILGLGQHGRSKTIRIERKAKNIKRQGKRGEPSPIYTNKPKYQFLNLRLKKDQNSRTSYDAGDYACNFSMYVISDFVKDKNIKFGFIHIPKNYNLDKAVRFVESKIDEIRKEKSA